MMMIVIFALIASMLISIWNSGVQSFVYESSDYHLMNEYLEASKSFAGYFSFTFGDNHFLPILKEGLFAFVPLVIISYAVGGICEVIIACIRGHEVAEGFLVTGILYPMTLPASIPYWMVALGVIFGVVVGKEIFGGTGMNILNPALVARSFLFFTFPGNMTGDVFVGRNPNIVASSLKQMNADAHLSDIDGYTQSSALQKINAIPTEVKKVQVDAIAAHSYHQHVPTQEVIDRQFTQWNATAEHHYNSFGDLTTDQLREFVTTPVSTGGLGLSTSDYLNAHSSVDSIFGLGKFTDGNLFFGNIIGSLGEISTLACIIGAIVLIYTGVGSWRTIFSVAIGAYVTALLFQLLSGLGSDGGAWNPARFSMPAYRHLLMGGLAFGLVYMATDPVSSPGMKSARWVYGALIGVVTILIRLINPAYPEEIMLAILFANVFAPLIDYYAVRNYRRVRRGHAVPGYQQLIPERGLHAIAKFCFLSLFFAWLAARCLLS